MRSLTVVVVLASLAGWTGSAAAQADPDRFELGVQIVSTNSSQFDETDVGIGGRLSWRPAGFVRIEAEMNLRPRDFPSQRPISRARVEALFGATVAADVGRVRPFARLRPGFVSFREAPEPIACILIFPPPLSCTLASGRTVFAFDVGGGVEVLPTRRTFVRVDAGDLVLKYPGPVFDNTGTVRERAFFSHDFRFAIGTGLRF